MPLHNNLLTSKFQPSLRDGAKIKPWGQDDYSKEASSSAGNRARSDQTALGKPASIYAIHVQAGRPDRSH